MQRRNSLLIVLGLLAIILLSSLYTVQETERGLVVRLGSLVVDKKTSKPEVIEPGLHMKMPFISSVLRFDKRLQTLQLDDSTIVTKEKKNVIVSAFVKWRIHDFGLYYIATGGNVAKAELLLSPKVGNELRAQFGQRTIPEVVSGERTNMMKIMQENIDASAGSLGIEVIDVRVKRIDLPNEVSESVYSRMRAEREQAAAEHRARGNKESETIRANADAQVTVLLAQADLKSSQLRGNGDLEAGKIYTQAYGQDAEFFAFYQSLKSYRATFSNKNDVLVLTPDTQFLKYFGNNKVGGE